MSAAAISLETWVHVYYTKWPEVPEHVLTDCAWKWRCVRFIFRL